MHVFSMVMGISGDYICDLQIHQTHFSAQPEKVGAACIEEQKVLCESAINVGRRLNTLLPYTHIFCQLFEWSQSRKIYGFLTREIPV